MNLLPAKLFAIFLISCIILFYRIVAAIPTSYQTYQRRFKQFRITQLHQDIIAMDSSSKMRKVLTGDLTFSSLKPIDLSNCTKREVKNYFENSFSMAESLFTALKDESVFYTRPDQLRMPLLFYYAHTAAVYINKVVLAGLLQPEDRVDLHYETIFETGVNEMAWDDTENCRMGGQLDWPDLDSVIDYRRKVREVILKMITETSMELPITMDSPWWGLFLGVEHERIHFETSSVLIRQLPVDLVCRPVGWNYAPYLHDSGAENNVMLRVEASDVILGKPDSFPSFGWENEYGHLNCHVPTFCASKYMITNRAFLEFVQSEGYQTEKYWTEEAWRWLQEKKVKHPTFWVCSEGCLSGCGGSLSSYSHCSSERRAKTCQLHNEQDAGDKYKYRCMFDVVAMPLDWPVEVNYHEAKAFCSWKGSGYRLLAEAEHHALRGNEAPLDEGIFCDVIFQDNPPVNINLRYGSASPVNKFESNELGFCDVYGNVWEWVEDHLTGLPGFQSSYLYDDYTSTYFDGRHNVMMGGSWASTGVTGSRFSRWWFRRHFYQHGGFRVACSTLPPVGEKLKLPVRMITEQVFIEGMGFQENVSNLDKDIYDINDVRLTYPYLQDSDSVLDVMLRHEYGQDGLRFNRLLVQTCFGWLNSYQVAHCSALHVGCGVGSATWHIANIFDHVIGHDFSGGLINTCKHLQQGDTLNYTVQEGSQEFAGASIDPNDNTAKIVFKQLTWLPNEIGVHDFVLVSFLNRVQNAKSWLVRLCEVLKKNGLLVISTPLHMDKECLSQYIGERFHRINTVDLTSGKITERVTAWKLRTKDL